MKKAGKTSCIIFALVVLFLLSSAVASGPTITDADWVAMNTNGTIGTSTLDGHGTTNALIYDDRGNLYAGGVYGVFLWNGTGWRQISTSMIGTVYSLAVDNDGNLYCGGNGNVNKWNGTSWSPLGLGTNGAVRAIVTDSSGNVYVGGSFNSAGGTAAKYVAKWDGSTWSAMGSGINDSSLKSTGVYALAVDRAGAIYAAGDFYTIRTFMVGSCIVKWDGVAWTPVVGSDNVAGKAYAIAFDSRGNLYAGGFLMTHNSSTMGYNLLVWNGTTWSGCAGGTNGITYALSADTIGNVYVGGEFSNPAINMDRYNSQKGWSTLGSGVQNTIIVNAIAADKAGHACIAGRKQTDISSFTDYIVEWRNGVLVTPQAVMNAVINIAIDRDKNIYVGGSFSTIGGISANNLARWNGTNWDTLGSGINSGVFTMTLDKSGNLYAGGLFFDKAGGAAAERVAKWNGSAWSALGSGMSNSVYTLACDPSGKLYAGGSFDTAGGVRARKVAVWDGSKWSALGSGLNWIPYTLVFDSIGNLYAGGDFDSAGGIAAKSIAKWNGSAWSALGTGTIGRVSTIAFDKSGNLYAGESIYPKFFDTLNRIEKWNGSTWSQIGEQTNGDIRTLIFDKSGNLYAGGVFTTIGGIVANNVARWNGSTWSALGSGTKLSGSVSQVQAFAIADSVMYVGGSFNIAGSKISPCIAKVNLNGTSSHINRSSETIFSSQQISYHILNSFLRISNLAPHDCVSLYSLSGRCIREAQGVSRIRLSGLAPQPLIVRVNREGRIVSTGMVMKE